MNTLERKKKLFLFSFLFIPTVLVLIFVVYPLLNMVILSFASWEGIGKKTFIGIDNYIRLFTDSPDSWRAIRNNGLYLFFGFVIIPFQILISAILISGIRGEKFYKIGIFMPYIINSVAIGYAFSFFFSPVNGGFNGILKALNLESLIRNWLSNEYLVNLTLNFVSYWKVFGFNIILICAALQSVPKEHLESAEVDGANFFQRLIFIQVPQISPTIKIISFMTIAGSLQVFDIPFIMTAGGPNLASTTFSLYAVNLAFKYNDYGLAAAMAVVLIIIILLINFIPKIVSYGIRKVWS